MCEKANESKRKLKAEVRWSNRSCHLVSGGDITGYRSSRAATGQSLGSCFYVISQSERRERSLDLLRFNKSSSRGLLVIDVLADCGAAAHACSRLLSLHPGF